MKSKTVIGSCLLVQLLVVLFYNSARSQNLVPNGSFEILDTCPIGTGGIYHANPWFQPVFWNGTNAFGTSSSELFNPCSSFILITAPNNSLGYQIAKVGNGYAGIVFYVDSGLAPVPNYREYIEVKLHSKLKPNAKYCMSFYVSLANNVKYGTSRIGAYFSEDSLIQRDTNYYNLFKPFNLIPQVENTFGNVITDTLNWVLIRGEFIAHGNEQFLTIGNFYDNPQTDSLTVLPSLFVEAAAYYYIDEVSLIEVKQALAGNDTSICVGDSVCIGANDSTVQCTWFPATGLSSTLISQPKAAPVKSTTYFVSLTDSCGYTSVDSVHITVYSCDSVITDSSYLDFPNIFSPNFDGINDVFKCQAVNIESYNCTIFNRFGIPIVNHVSVNETWDGYTRSGKILPEGVYYYTCSAKGKDAKEYLVNGFVTLIR